MVGLEATPSWLRANIAAPVHAVDRGNRIIRGVIGAEEGAIKDGRGEFNKQGLQGIVALATAKPAGLKARFTHPGLSSDGLGKYLGRFKNPRLANISRNGVARQAVRFDLHFDQTAHSTPDGDLATYVMDLAESDPEAFGASLVLQVKEEEQLDKHGRQLVDAEGNAIPPLWYPTVLHALDVVDSPAATNSFLSTELSFDDAVKYGSQILDAQFPKASREVIEARLSAWGQRYLDGRFGQRERPAVVKEPTLIAREIVAKPGSVLEMTLREQGIDLETCLARLGVSTKTPKPPPPVKLLEPYRGRWLFLNGAVTHAYGDYPTGYTSGTFGPDRTEPIEMRWSHTEVLRGECFATYRAEFIEVHGQLNDNPRNREIMAAIKEGGMGLSPLHTGDRVSEHMDHVVAGEKVFMLYRGKIVEMSFCPITHMRTRGHGGRAAHAWVKIDHGDSDY